LLVHQASTGNLLGGLDSVLTSSPGATQQPLTSKAKKKKNKQKTQTRFYNSSTLLDTQFLNKQLETWTMDMKLVDFTREQSLLRQFSNPFLFTSIQFTSGWS
jgi:hypothetical protein